MHDAGRTARRPLHSALLALALVSLAACGRPASSPPSAPSQAAATAAQPPATATVSAPDGAATSPTAPAAAAELHAAFTRAAELHSYQVAFRYGAVVADGAPLMDYSATFNGDDLAFRFTMPADGAPAGQPQTLDIVTVGGITYARGPLPLAGAEQPVWYTLGTRPPPATTPPFTAARLIDLLTERIDLAALATDGTEEIAGQACTRYRGGLDVALGMMDSFGRPTTPEAMAAEATPVVPRMEAQGYTFGPAEALVWVCGEQVRRVQASVQGTGPADPAAAFTLQTSLDLTEVDASSGIAAPVEPVAPGEAVPLATVFNGGNLRAQPTLQGEIQDQIHAGESVRLLAMSADAGWYRIVNPRDVVGWVSASLLRVSPADAALVTVAAPLP